MAAPAADPIALVDMDGTLCDYPGALVRDLARLAAPGEPPAPLVSLGEVGPGEAREPPYLRERKDMIRRQPGWWMALQPLPIGFEIVALLRELAFEIHVLTKGPRHIEEAWMEKVRWCRQHLPGVPVSIVPKKAMVYGKVLVDDWPPYIEQWLARRPRGLVIIPAQPWNQGFAHPNALHYDGQNKDELRRRLTAVRAGAPGHLQEAT